MFHSNKTNNTNYEFDENSFGASFALLRVIQIGEFVQFDVA